MRSIVLNSIVDSLNIHIENKLVFDTTCINNVAVGRGPYSNPIVVESRGI